MVVMSRAPLRQFIERDLYSGEALVEWYTKVMAADWKNFNEVKKTFNTCDYVGNDRYVFNIMGNQYRVVALIIFRKRTLFILFIGTHKEYDKIDAAQITYKK
jgi:mRNA interferase HigB